MAMSRDEVKEWLITHRIIHKSFKSNMIGRTPSDTVFTLKDPRTGESISRRRFNKFILPELGLTEEEYYLKYSGITDIPLVCPVCGEPLTFINIFRGYRKCCDKKDCSGRSLIKSICEEIEMEDLEARAVAVSAMHSETAREKASHSISISTKKRYESQEERDKTGAAVRESKLNNFKLPRGGSSRLGLHIDLYSESDGRVVGFDSTWEAEYYEKSLKNPEVKEIKRLVGFTIEYFTKSEEQIMESGIIPEFSSRNYNQVGHAYHPDFLQFMKNGEIWVVEIKPEKDMDDEIVQAKIKYAIPYCNSHGYRYVIFNDDLSTPHFYN